MLDHELQSRTSEFEKKTKSALVVGSGLTACIVISALETLGISVAINGQIGLADGLFHSCERKSLTSLMGSLSRVPEFSRQNFNSKPIEIIRCDNGFSVTFENGAEGTFACVFLAVDCVMSPIPDTLPKETMPLTPSISYPPPRRSMSFILDYYEPTDPSIGLSALRLAHDNQAAGGQSAVFLQHAPVRGLYGESLYEASRQAGVHFVRFGDERPKVMTYNHKDSGARLFRIEARDITQNGDNIVIESDDGFVATNPIFSNFPEVFNTLLYDEIDSRGGLIKDSMRCVAGKSFRRGIYSIGPASGCFDLVQTMDVASTAAVDAKSWIGKLQKQTSENKMTVLDQCVRCLTCLRICPHMAISLKPETSRSTVEVSASRCIECGICVAECPMTSLELNSFPKDAFTDLFKRLKKNPFGEKVVVFGCHRSAGRAVSSIEIPADVIFFPVSCAGRLSESIMSAAVLAGARGVLVIGCHHGNCASNRGTDWARARVESIYSKLETVFTGSFAVSHKTLAANEPFRMAEIINEFVESTKQVFE